MKRSSSNTLSRQFVTVSSQETNDLGVRLGKKLKKGHVILLLGDLGAGKTTFVKGVAQGLGGAQEALSPTFIIAQTIEGKVPIHHLDFYRVTPPEILGIGIEDYLLGIGEIEKGVVLIEWADRFKEIWPKERLEIQFRVKPGIDRREINFSGIGKSYVTLLRPFFR